MRNGGEPGIVLNITGNAEIQRPVARQAFQEVQVLQIRLGQFNISQSFQILQEGRIPKLSYFPQMNLLQHTAV